MGGVKVHLEDGESCVRSKCAARVPARVPLADRGGTHPAAARGSLRRRFFLER